MRPGPSPASRCRPLRTVYWLPNASTKAWLGRLRPGRLDVGLGADDDRAELEVAGMRAADEAVIAVVIAERTAVDGRDVRDAVAVEIDRGQGAEITAVAAPGVARLDTHIEAGPGEDRNRRRHDGSHGLGAPRQVGRTRLRRSRDRPGPRLRAEVSSLMLSLFLVGPWLCFRSDRRSEPIGPAAVLYGEGFVRSVAPRPRGGRPPWQQRGGNVRGFSPCILRNSMLELNNSSEVFESNVLSGAWPQRRLAQICRKLER